MSAVIKSIENTRDQELCNLAHDLECLYQSKMAERPYVVNVIKELHADENANSRILKAVFLYKKGNDYPLLDSFLEYVCKVGMFQKGFVINTPEITYQENDIDILIKETYKYAVIIENKIWDAKDQPDQISKYVNYCKKIGIPEKEIFVVYLTKDGTKKVKEYSLTPNAKISLGMTEKSKGRFVEMNFVDHIVPWLDECQKNVFVKEEPLLQSTIMQYYDYLANELEITDEDAIISNEINSTMKEKLNISSLVDLVKVSEEVSALQARLAEERNNIINEFCQKQFVKPLENKGYKIKETAFDFDQFTIKVYVPGWEKTYFGFEFFGNSFTWGIAWNDSNDIYVRSVETIKSKYYKSNNYWPGWSKDSSLNPDSAFWIKVYENPKSMLSMLLKHLNEAQEWTKDLKM